MTYTGRIVVKSNALIEASYKLTTQEQLILLYALSEIRKGDVVTDDRMYVISAHDIAKLTGRKKDALYTELEQSALRLKAREVRIYGEPNSKEKRHQVLVTNWLQSVAYSRGDGEVHVRFSRDIVPYISALNKHFTIYRLGSIPLLKSAYAVHIYELLVQWRGNGTRTVEVGWLREHLQISDMYPRMKDLKLCVIDLAKDQINEHTDLWVDYTQKKTGRKVTHFIFTYGEKNPKQVIDDEAVKKNARPGESEWQVQQRLQAKARPKEEQAKAKPQELGPSTTVKEGVDKSIGWSKAELMRAGIPGESDRDTVRHLHDAGFVPGGSMLTDEDIARLHASIRPV